MTTYYVCEIHQGHNPTLLLYVLYTSLGHDNYHSSVVEASYTIIWMILSSKPHSAMNTMQYIQICFLDQPSLTKFVPWIWGWWKWTSLCNAFQLIQFLLTSSSFLA